MVSPPACSLDVAGALASPRPTQRSAAIIVGTGVRARVQGKLPLPCSLEPGVGVPPHSNNS